MALDTNIDDTTEGGKGSDSYSPLLAKLLKIDPQAMDSVSLSALGRQALGSDSEQYVAARKEVDDARAAMVQALQARKSGVDPSMLALAAGFFAPTSTGSFGESLAGAIKGYTASERQQSQEAAELAKMRYELARGTMQDEATAAKLGLDVVSKLTPQMTALQKQVRAEGLDPNTPAGQARVRELQAMTSATSEMKEFAARSGISVTDPTFAAKFSQYSSNKPLADVAARLGVDLNTPEGVAAARAEVSRKALREENPELVKILEAFGGDITKPADVEKARAILRTNLARTTSPEIAKQLELFGGNINNPDDVERARLMLRTSRARSENPEVVKILESFGGDILNDADLTKARGMLRQNMARANSPEIAKILETFGGSIDNPADVNRARETLRRNILRTEDPELTKILSALGGDILNPDDVSKARALLKQRLAATVSPEVAKMLETFGGNIDNPEDVAKARSMIQQNVARTLNPEIAKTIERIGGDINNPADVARARVEMQEASNRAARPELAKVLEEFGGKFANPADVKRAEGILTQRRKTEEDQKKASLASTLAATQRTRQEIAANARPGAGAGAGAGAGVGTGAPGAGAPGAAPDPYAGLREVAAGYGVPLASMRAFSNMTPKEVIAKQNSDANEAAKYIRDKVQPFLTGVDADIDNLRRALALNSEISTGFSYGLPVIGDVAKLASGDRAKINEFDALSALSAKQNRIPGDSNVSNLDVKMMQLGTFSSDKEPKTNKTIIEFMLAQRERDRDYNNYLTAYAAVNGRIDAEANAYWKKYLDANPITSRDSKGRVTLNPNRMDYKRYFTLPRVSVDANGRERRP
jgi:hypothetical protein